MKEISIIIMIIILTLILLFLIIDFLYNKYFFISKTFDIKSNKIKGTHKFIFITDLHEKTYGKDNKKLLDDIFLKNIKDILIGGDLINFSKKNSNKKPNIESAKIFLKEISKDKNVYYSFGNHELRLKSKSKKSDFFLPFYNDLIKAINDDKVKLLDDDYIDLNDNIRIYGYSLFGDFYKKSMSLKKNEKVLTTDIIEKDLGKLDKNKFNIALLHIPDYAESMIDYGFDLVLSGHHHGGMIRFPIFGSIFGPDLTLFPKYTKGEYLYKNKKIIVCAGLGEHTFKIRINNTPEYYIINLLGE